MLVISRRQGEAVLIGDTIKVHIVRIRSGQVRIGVDAPKDIVVDREEVAQRKAHDAVIT